MRVSAGPTQQVATEGGTYSAAVFAAVAAEAMPVAVPAPPPKGDDVDEDGVAPDRREPPQEVFLALSYHQSAHKLGFCSYNTFTNVLGFAELFMFDEDTGDVLHRVQSHVLATTIIVSDDMDEGLLDIIRGNHTAIQQSGEHGDLGDLDVSFQKPMCFNFKKVRLRSTLRTW